MKKIIEINKNDEEALEEISKLYEKIGDYDSYEKKHTNLRDCSGEVKIPLGVHGIITNSVREGGCNRARLYINSGKEKATQGVWSPDSTANSSYVVFK